MVVDLKCEEVWREISNYIDGEIALDLRRGVEVHFRVCRNCSAILDGTRNVVQLSGDGKLFDVPQGFGQRLFGRRTHLQASEPAPVQQPTDMLLGITNDRALTSAAQPGFAFYLKPRRDLAHVMQSGERWGTARD